ncbi:MAG: holo-acyl-carrier protein synthase [Mucilaginibacter sp.]|nr:holo-acyl-carrier protein synthase [Mucilaginibacter sp.]
MLTAALILWDLVLMEKEIKRALDELIPGNKFSAGNDIVFIPDFEKSFTESFKNKVYTANEIAYCDQFDNPLLRYASTWAAKEAVYKAVKQIDPSALGPKKIEIFRDKPVGRPKVIIHRDSVKFDIALSISHDGDYAWAIAFIENL